MPNKKHSVYWQKRMDDILRHVDQTDINMFKELSDVYSDYAKEVQDDIFKFYGKYADGEGITLKEAKKRLRSEDLSDYQANARKYFEEAKDNPELLERLNEQYRASRVTRLEALELDMEYRAGVMNGTLQGVFEGYLKQTAAYAYKKVMGGRSASTLNEPALRELINRPWNGYNYSEDLWGNTDNLAQDLKKALEKGFIRGSGPREIANEIRNKYGVAQHRAETLVRTDGTNIINNATAKRYQDAGLKTYKIHVHIDNRTTKICRNIAEKDEVYLFSKYEPGITAPPFHFNCRSTVVPDEDELMSEV